MSRGPHHTNQTQESRGILADGTSAFRRLVALQTDGIAR